jgi:alkanesulfonate monooxygenase SsuD/methylene tetrahydromethanopterin reductase-like flavin-dependent oxidoreductase (luciferase family)
MLRVSITRISAGDAMAGPFAPRYIVVLGQRASWPEMLARTRTVEDLGFDGLYLVDHYFGRIDLDEPTHEAWTMLGALAPFTQSMRLGVLVCGNTYRNPAFLLKQAVTVDHISNGRVDFGVGAGWLEREHEAYGFPLPPPRERVDRFEEALGIWEALQHQYRTTWDGEHYQLLDAPFEPKPVQPGGLPLLIGSSGRRMMRLVARHADIWNTIGTPAEAETANRTMDAICAEVGRDPSTLRRSVSPSLNLLESPEAFAVGIAAYHAAGFTDITFPWPRVEAEVPVLREVAATVLPGLHGADGRAPAGTPPGLEGIDPEEVATIVAALDPAARSFVALLAAHPGAVVERAQVMSALDLDHHADVTRLAMGIATVFEAAGWQRPWREVQKGFTMSPEVAGSLNL